MHPFIHWEGCTKDWCGPSQPLILCTFNITPLPLLHILHALCNILFVPYVLSLILYSSVIYFTSTISTELRKWAQFKKPLTSYVFGTYLMTSTGKRYQYYHPPTKTPWRCNESQGTDFCPFSLLLCSCFQLVVLVEHTSMPHDVSHPAQCCRFCSSYPNPECAPMGRRKRLSSTKLVDPFWSPA